MLLDLPGLLSQINGKAPAMGAFDQTLDVDRRTLNDYWRCELRYQALAFDASGILLQ
jgi:hypothetical protein